MRLDFTQIDWSKRTEPAALPEWMDGPCSYEQFRACLLDIEKVNRLSFGYRPTLTWLDALVADKRAEEPLRIVDVGCGGGDMLRQIAAWARKREVKVDLTGVDLNPFSTRAASEFSKAEKNIHYVTGDAFSYTPESGMDVVLSSLFTHHLPTEEIVQFLAWMERVAHVGWFVNDLCREPLPYYGFGMLAKVAGWHRFVQHDGPVSFRRSFREDDWQRMCAAAQVGVVSLQRWTPARLCVGRVK